MVDVQELIKVLLKPKSINIDNHIFRLHYRFTVILLILFAFLVTSKEYFGEPITCQSDSKDKYSLDTYCWIYSTFTVKRHLKGKVGESVIAPGVGPSQAIMSTSNSDEIIVHKYYQWVSIVLFSQAILFYIPRYLWKIWEAGRMKAIVQDFGSPIIKTWTQQTKDELITYITQNSHLHNIYMIRYIFCELLNFFNVIFQIILMNWFLSGHFMNFGVALTTFALSEAVPGPNPMSYIFPKLSKCTYRNFGPSGTVQELDALCLLPLNIINEKIYAILWFWFLFLAMITFIALMYRALVICNKTVRAYLLMAHARNFDRMKALNLVKHLSFGDWFMLYQMGKNINPNIFHELLTELRYTVMSKKLNNHIL